MNAHYFLNDSSKRESGLIINQMTNSIYMAISEAKKGGPWEESKKLFLRIDDRICHRSCTNRNHLSQH